MTTTILVLIVILSVVALVAVVDQKSNAHALRRLESAVDRFATTIAESRPDATEAPATSPAELAERLDRIERMLREISEREPSESGPAQVAKEVQPLLRDATAAIEHQLRELHDVLASGAEQSTADLVNRALSRQGFSQVEMVSVPKSDGGRTSVAVEARRDGMTYKGTVVLDGTKVIEQQLSPSYPMFP